MKHQIVGEDEADLKQGLINVSSPIGRALIGKKRTDKMAYRHSGRPGGLKAVPYGELLATDPRHAVERAVWGMLPKNKLSRQLLSKLKVYSGPEHPHAAQQPQPFEITQIAQ